MSNYITIKLRRGTQAQWAATNPVLAEGEFGAETDTRKFKIGNGVTAWNSLSYWGSAGGGAADFTDLGDVPASYTGQAGKFVKVKSTEDGLEFGTLTIAAADLPSGIDAAKIANGSVSNTEFQYLDGATSNIQTQINNRVPYTGASGDVNLGEWGIQLGNLEFDNTPTNTPATDGSVFWDSGDGTLQLQMKGGATQKVGMNTFARVYNDSGVQLIKGDVVYISGAQGNRIAAKKAQANSESTAKNTFAIVVETIAAGAEGMVITEGPLYNLTTTGLTAGATLYLSPSTAGGYTQTQPQAPDHLVIIGFVERVHASAGSIYVKISNGYELEELHDVDLTESKITPVDADALLLQDSADSSIWKRLTWANLKATAKSYFDTLYAAVIHTHAIGDVTNLQTTLDGKVDENAAITPATKTKISYDAKGLVTAGADAAIADITGLQTALDGKVDENAAITGATKTKITYDAKGLVTAGADATTADIADSLNKRYVTDADLTKLANTSGTNTGDQNIFSTIAVAGQSNVVADGTGDTLTLVAGSNITITTDATTDSVTIASTGGGGVSDGDKGDITVSSSGTVWTVDNDAITYAKIQNVSAASRLLGRGDSGSGDVQEITLGSGLTMTGTTLSASAGAGTVLSPSQITSWQNNYNPTSWGSGVQTLRISSSSAFNGITGITATTGGHRVKIVNVGSFAFIIVDESADSTAANRLSAGQDLYVFPGRTIELEYDSTSSRWRLVSGYNLAAEDPAYVRTVQMQYSQTNSGISSALNGFPLYWSGSGGRSIQVVGTSGFRGRWGVLAMTVDNSTRSGVYSDNNSFTIHDGTIYLSAIYQTSIRFETLSNATDRYISRIGFLDSDTGTPIDGLFLEYSDNVNSGQWTFNAYDTSTVTTVNSTSAVAAGTWYAIKIVAYPNNTARAYVNGVLVATLTTGLPGSGRDFGWYAGFRKTAGTTLRTMYVDYCSANLITPSIV